MTEREHRDVDYLAHGVVHVLSSAKHHVAMDVLASLLLSYLAHHFHHCDELACGIRVGARALAEGLPLLCDAPPPQVDAIHRYLAATGIGAAIVVELPRV